MRIYKWRAFDYSDEYKVGGEVTVAPLPPTLFADTYLFKPAKKFLIDEDAGLELSPHGVLLQRVAA